MTILEVMGAGVPVVATAVGGVPEVVDAPRAGWLVPAEDARALAHIIGEALVDDDGRGGRGRASRDRAEQAYGPEPWVQRHLTAYRAAGRAGVPSG